MIKPKVLSEEVVNLLLPRVKDEYTAFYHYQAASNWCKGVGFDKAADFFANEAKDELEHAKGLETFLVDWNVIVKLPPITAFLTS